MIEMRREVEDSRSGTETKTETKETKVETAEISIDPRTIELCVRCGTCRSSSGPFPDGNSAAQSAA